MCRGSETLSHFFNADLRTPMLHSNPSLFSVDVLKRCALFALHLFAEEGRGADGCYALGLRDESKMGCPKSQMWESEGEAWSEDESVSSSGTREGNVCNDALHVIGLYGPSDKISLFLKDWELAKVALSCHMALDLLCQEMHEAWQWGMLPRGVLSRHEMPFSHRGRAVTVKERDVVGGNSEREGSVAGLGGLSGPVGILPFNCCCSVHTLCLFGMSVSFQTCLCVCCSWHACGSVAKLC